VVKATLGPLHTRERESVPVLRQVAWAPWAFWTGVDNLAFGGFRTPKRPTRKESLHHLRYVQQTVLVSSETLRNIKNPVCQNVEHSNVTEHVRPKSGLVQAT
jgi:hypothetical protein